MPWRGGLGLTLARSSWFYGRCRVCVGDIIVRGPHDPPEISHSWPLSLGEVSRSRVGGLRSWVGLASDPKSPVPGRLGREIKVAPLRIPRTYPYSR